MNKWTTTTTTKPLPQTPSVHLNWDGQHTGDCIGLLHFGLVSQRLKANSIQLWSDTISNIQVIRFIPIEAVQEYECKLIMLCTIVVNEEWGKWDNDMIRNEMKQRKAKQGANKLRCAMWACWSGQERTLIEIDTQHPVRGHSLNAK